MSGSASKVAVTVGRSPSERYSLHRGYIDALWDLGVSPIVLPAGTGGDEQRISDLVLSCDALLLTGGADIHPDEYRSEPTGLEKDCDPDRDRLEITAVRSALRGGKRVLGICRGIQLLAVALGGTLVADLPSAGHAGHQEEDHEEQRVHGVHGEPGTLAHRALAGFASVNSLHHQAVLDCGPDLRVSAWSEDGVVEAVECDLALGVQWHPERLPKDDRGRLAPFEWLVDQ